MMTTFSRSEGAPGGGAAGATAVEEPGGAGDADAAAIEEPGSAGAGADDSAAGAIAGAELLAFVGFRALFSPSAAQPRSGDAAGRATSIQASSR